MRRKEASPHKRTQAIKRKANWLMVRAPHLKQRDAEFSATATGTTTTMGVVMADARESGAPEDRVLSTNPVLSFFFRSLDDGSAVLGRRAGLLGVRDAPAM